MWYVINVESGQEENMCGRVAGVTAEVVQCQIFVPKYICMWKKGGEWTTVTRPLFSGYLFMEVNGEMDDELKRMVQKRLHVFTTMKAEPVCIGGGFYPIRDSEQKLLEDMMNSQHEVEKSVGNIVNGELIIHSGPLKGRTHLVTKINRHNRFGIMRTTLWGEERMMKVGLEVISKS